MIGNAILKYFYYNYAILNMYIVKKGLVSKYMQIDYQRLKENMFYIYYLIFKFMNS